MKKFESIDSLRKEWQIWYRKNASGFWASVEGGIIGAIVGLGIVKWILIKGLPDIPLMSIMKFLFGDIKRLLFLYLILVVICLLMNLPDILAAVKRKKTERGKHEITQNKH